MASIASYKVQWDFVLGQRSRDNVISGTERTVSEIHNRVANADKQASRQREQEFKGHLDSLEGISAKSGENLLRQKKRIAQQAAGTYKAGARARGKAAASTHGTVRTQEAGIKRVAQAGEQAYKRIQARRKDMLGRTGAASFQKDLIKFSRLSQKEQKAELELQRGQNEELEEEIRLKKEAYHADKGDMSKSEQYSARKEYEDLEMELGERTAMLDEYNNVMKSGKPLEDAHIQRQGKLKEAIGRLNASRGEQKRLEKEISFQRSQAYTQLTREIESTTGEIGQGLRNAFVYATAAMTAFYYKLNEVNQTVMQFENELINAKSIWQNSNDELFQLSDQVVQFGNTFGIEMNKATEGLYQYASAGVEASEAMEMLTHTLTLAMAVQGDHNTLSKLTVQTIKGFGMEFSAAEEVTDKFAHAINKSLIEWDDLASSIKFALPFFISTGQSLDQLLGALQILTDRALEAGIAGRGLRQALAEFTQHAEDNAAAFRKLGIEILDVEGNMYPLDQIAQQFNDTLGEQATDMEVMITLMEDLNVRGATAFIHLVQGADEYSAAVKDLANSAGESHEMAMVQQESLANQIQLLKNALLTPFLLADEVTRADGHMNEFLATLHNIVSMFEDLIVTGEDGHKTLTDIGEFMRDFVVVAMQEFALLMMQVIDLVREWESENEAAYGTISLLVVPLNALLKILKDLGPHWINTIMFYRIMSKLLPMHIGNTIHQLQLEMTQIALMEKDLALKQVDIALTNAQIQLQVLENTADLDHWEIVKQQVAIDTIREKQSKIRHADDAIDYSMTLKLIGAKLTLNAAMFSLVAISGKFAQDSPKTAWALSAIAGAIGGVAIAYQIFKDTVFKGGNIFYAIAAGAAAGMLFHGLMKKMMAPPDMSEWDSKLSGVGSRTTSDYTTPVYDTGGRVLPMYATGGRARGQHFPVLVEPGETIISKTQNMLGVGAAGITVHVGDVYTQDGTDFADKLAEALPLALQRQSDIGGI